jgi:hypothetical protein
MEHREPGNIDALSAAHQEPPPMPKRPEPQPFAAIIAELVARAKEGPRPAPVRGRRARVHPSG